MLLVQSDLFNWTRRTLNWVEIPLEFFLKYRQKGYLQKSSIIRNVTACNNFLKFFLRQKVNSLRKDLQTCSEICNFLRDAINFNQSNSILNSWESVQILYQIKFILQLICIASPYPRSPRQTLRFPGYVICPPGRTTFNHTSSRHIGNSVRVSFPQV